MCVLALDLGATFIKGARVHPETGLIEQAVRRPFPGFKGGLPAGRREVPLNEILNSVRGVLGDLLRDGPPPRGLYLCGQMHGLVLVAPDGTALSDFSSWQDARALEPAPDGAGSSFDALCKGLGVQAVTELGNELKPGFPLARLYAMAARSDLPAKAAPLSLPDYVALALCGRLDQPITDPTNAAAHGAFHSVARRWHGDALRHLGLDRLGWPEIRPAGTRLGDLRHGEYTIPVHVPIGDQQAALLGAGLEDRELSLNIATGSQVSMLAGEPVAGNWQVRPFIGGRWLRTITHLPAGRALNGMLGLLGELAADQGTPLKDPWGQIERMVAQFPSVKVRANLAFFPCTVGNHGGFGQLTEEELHPGPLFRAAFESMASNYRAAAQRIAPQGWSRVVFSGGLVQKSDALRQEILRQLGSEHRLAPHAEDTLCGLMRLAKRSES